METTHFVDLGGDQGQGRSTGSRGCSKTNEMAHLAPMNPGTTRRNGAPCDLGSGSPFISQASRTSSCLAFLMGIETASTATYGFGQEGSAPVRNGQG